MTTPHSTIADILANIAVSHEYLRRSCQNLGEATNADDVELATAFVLSAGGEIERWVKALGEASE